MNVEVYSYSILASILGISVVFLVLVGLCLLMILLKKVFDEKEKPAAASPAGGASAPAALPSSGPAQDSSLWLMAAVAAYLEEEALGAPKAGSWVRAYAEVSDPWMNRATFDKSLG